MVLALQPQGAVLRVIVFLTAVAIVTIYVGLEHRPVAALAESPRVSRPGEIRSVSLDGRSLPVTTLHQLLETRVGDVVDDAKLARDRAALEEALIGSGYLAAKVRKAQLVFGDGGAAFVTFAIVQGPQFRVRSVNVVGVSELDAGVVTLAAGEALIADRIARARDALAERLAARGKRSNVVVNLKRDQRTSSVDVELVAR